MQKLSKDCRILAQMRVLDISNQQSDLFDEKDWEEIRSFLNPVYTAECAQIPELPFGDLKELRRLAGDLIAEPKEGLEWLGNALSALGISYDTDAVQTANNERACDSLWTGFIEQSFLMGHWRLSRGESESKSIRELLNGNRESESTKRVPGPKFDGIIVPKERYVGLYPADLELGFIEVAKDKKKKYDSKYIKDCVKVSKGMVASFLIGEGPDMRVSVLTFRTRLSLVFMKRHPCGLFVTRVREAVELPHCYNGVAVRKVAQEIALLQFHVSQWKLQ